MNTLQITVNSAWSTLVICDRQSRKDTAKLIELSYSAYLAVTSPEAIALYRTIIDITVHPWKTRDESSDNLKLYQAGVRAIALAGMMAMFVWSLFREWSDRYIDSCLEKPVVEEVVEEAIDRVAVPIAASCTKAEAMHDVIKPTKNKKPRTPSLKAGQKHIKVNNGGVIAWDRKLAQSS